MYSEILFKRYIHVNYILKYMYLFIFSVHVQCLITLSRGAHFICADFLPDGPIQQATG